MATAASAALAEFPHAAADAGPIRVPLTLEDACDQGGVRLPDLVLLRAASLPTACFMLQPSALETLEIGEAEAQAMVLRPGDGEASWEEVTIDGTLRDRLRPDGRRQLSGLRAENFWFVRGSSGAPVFRKGGQQLAGLLSLSELGVNERRSQLQEAFVVPGTVIRAHLARRAAAPAARDVGIPLAELDPILAEIGAADTPLTELPGRLLQFVRQARARAAEPQPASTDGADIDAAIGVARAKLGALDSAGALVGLDAKIAQEEAARRQRMLPLLREKLAIQTLTYDHAGARETVQRILDLDPDAVWDWIALGDLHQRIGALAEANAAFEHALAAARRIDAAGRDAASALDRIGDVQRAQGALPAALQRYEASLAIVERLARADPGNTEWQRDLSVSLNRIGDVQVAQGALPAALQRYEASLAIRERLARADSGNTEWQRDLLVSCVRLAEADPPRAQNWLRRALAIARALEAAGRLAPADARIPAELERRLRAAGG